ncbi:cell division protein (ZipA-like) [Moraxella macacae 0408225]|uniref:Cell division protein ZipA n=1 Tax=Moraxella macacae 0408225 TaxID=1230338 RepID=L2F6Z2_9GAMM|nr:cell division protein ZipA C-terminal FtsZ-binding domain-containing protein [Moraxella macacae]ELA08807.1 cell division protein (ZipA-like) [Moraxella macacae 0408225]
MTVMNFLLIVVAVVAIAWGAYVLFSAKNSKQPSLENVSDSPADKDGLPILPRHQRPSSDNPNSDDKTEAKKNITLSAKNTDFTEPDASSKTTTPNQTDHHASQHETQSAQATQQDAFSALANATETITPVVQTYDERKLKKDGFSDTSPILDDHIQAQIDNDQDSPLNHAVQNLNISLFPKEQFSRILGRDLLKLFDKYGLKFGAMNMFHRYANKDGTGLLWFSVMMVTEEGILPFDLNKLPNQYVKGLVMFVSLPHPEASRGFDSMVSISGLLSQDLQAYLYDETGEPLNKENIQQMREIALNFAK